MTSSRVLVVESSPPAALVLRTALEHGGFSVQVVRSATGVRQALERDDVIAVVLSMDLAAADEIIRDVAAQDLPVPIIAMASVPSAVDASRVAAVMKKPVDATVLVQTVDQLVPRGDRPERPKIKTPVPSAMGGVDRERLVAVAAIQKAMLDMQTAVLEGIVGRTDIEPRLERILGDSLRAIGRAYCAIWIGHTAEEPTVKVGWPGDEEAVNWRITASTAVLTGRAMSSRLNLDGTGQAMFAIAPILSRGEVLGAVVVAKPSESLADDEWLDFGRALGVNLGRALEVHAAVRRAELAASRAIEKAKSAELVAKVAIALGSTRDLDSALDGCTMAMEEAWSATVRVFTPKGPAPNMEVRGPGRYRVPLADEPALPIMGLITDGRPVAADRSIVHPIMIEGRLAAVLAVTSKQTLRPGDKDAVASVAATFAERLSRSRAML